MWDCGINNWGKSQETVKGSREIIWEGDSIVYVQDILGNNQYKTIRCTVYKFQWVIVSFTSIHEIVNSKVNRRKECQPVLKTLSAFFSWNCSNFFNISFNLVSQSSSVETISASSGVDFCWSWSQAHDKC